ncbi:MAG: hypothetical protein ACLGHP_08770, partial [Vicinamibacteria bacterium]
MQSQLQRRTALAAARIPRHSTTLNRSAVERSVMEGLRALSVLGCAGAIELTRVMGAARGR